MASPRTRKSAPALSGESASTETSVSAGPVVTLAQVIEATKADGFVYTAPAFHAALVESGDVEINPEMTDAHGNIATRATAKHTQESSAPMTEHVTAAKPSFEIETVPMPERTRKPSGLRAGRTPLYPFDSLEVGQSFFVADKAADKPAFKAMASTVAGANARHSEVIEGQTRVNRKKETVPATRQLRKFKIVEDEKNGQKGARIFRVAVTEPEAAKA